MVNREDTNVPETPAELEVEQTSEKIFDSNMPEQSLRIWDSVSFEMNGEQKFATIVSEVHEQVPFVTVILDLKEEEPSDLKATDLRFSVNKSSLTKIPNTARPGAVVAHEELLLPGSLVILNLAYYEEYIVEYLCMENGIKKARVFPSDNSSISELKIFKKVGRCFMRYAFPRV